MLPVELGSLPVLTRSLLLFVLICAPAPAFAESPGRFSPGRAGFSVKFKSELSNYVVTGLFVMPAESVTLEAVGGDGAEAFEMEFQAGELRGESPRRWRWQAPSQTGLYRLEIRSLPSGETIVLNAFVMVPFGALIDEMLHGYRMGRYPEIPLKLLPLYHPPAGFIEVTTENENVEVAPHFRLGQFLCKQDGGYPKYLVLKERLLLKLELILERVNERGYRCDGFHVMSGYRTPYYNEAIGNVRYSRHLWGGAADIFIDESPRDDMMDDLNGDGRIDSRDADVIYDIIDDMYGRPFYAPFLGGLGSYEKTAAHGPFVHVDVRGFRARWGS